MQSIQGTTKKALLGGQRNQRRQLLAPLMQLRDSFMYSDKVTTEFAVTILCHDDVLPDLSLKLFSLYYTLQGRSSRCKASAYIREITGSNLSWGTEMFSVIFLSFSRRSTPHSMNYYQSL